MHAKDVDKLLDAREDVPGALAKLSGDITSACDAIVRCLKSGGVVYACGNGGSASQASHFAAELVGRFLRDRDALPAFSLVDNVSSLSALANDYGYDDVFSRQLRGVARSNDCLFAISTSGNSKNVVRACQTAREQGTTSIVLTGASGGEVAPLADIAVRVSLEDTPRIQEAHLAIIHILCELVEDAIFPSRG